MTLIKFIVRDSAAAAGTQERAALHIESPFVEIRTQELNKCAELPELNRGLPVYCAHDRIKSQLSRGVAQW
jgi:hypothetical protein